MPSTMKPVDPKWSKKFADAQAKLGLTNAEMAEKLGVGVRTYLSWKYRERNPSKTAVELLKFVAR
jgi:DNA-binding transcriptional regulator YiaG